MWVYTGYTYFGKQSPLFWFSLLQLAVLRNAKRYLLIVIRESRPTISLHNTATLQEEHEELYRGLKLSVMEMERHPNHHFANLHTWAAWRGVGHSQLLILLYRP